MGIKTLEARISRDTSGPQHEHRLDKTDDTGSGLKVTDVRFHSAKHAWVAGRRNSIGFMESFVLNGVTERCSRAMRLDVAH